MKLGSFVTGLIVVIAAGVAAPPLPAVADQLGTAWNVREGADWSAIWTRRGTSNVFDAVSTHRYTLKKITAVLTTTVKGSAVSIQRRNGSDGVDVQNGTQVTMTRAAKYKGRWIVSLCRGVLSGNKLRAECDYAPGGNPFGFGATIESWVVSQDGNHLDGAIAGVHESHYSRIP